MRCTWGRVVTAALGVLALGACGDDDPSTADAVADASTCTELVDSYQVDAVTDEEAALIAARLIELTEADFADDGVLDDLLTCNRVIRDLDKAHPSAFAGIDLEVMDLNDGNARSG